MLPADKVEEEVTQDVSQSSVLVALISLQKPGQSDAGATPRETKGSSSAAEAAAAALTVSLFLVSKRIIFEQTGMQALCVTASVIWPLPICWPLQKRVQAFCWAASSRAW